MTSIVHAGIEIQLSPEVKAAVPPWFEEVLVIATYLKEQHRFASLSEQVRFARARMGRYDLMDFVVVLLGYALSGERSIQDWYQRLAAHGTLFMDLFERDHLPHRSTLSRFLAALTPACVEQLRQDLLVELATQCWPHAEEAGWWDRSGRQWVLFDVDGTRAVARQRALPQSSDLPLAQRRREQVCAKGYTGRKRGEVVRTRTTVLHFATGQWVGTFSGVGNGAVKEELSRALTAIGTYAALRSVPPSALLVRLDGLYGSGAYISLLQDANIAFVLRGKDYGVLAYPEIQARLALPADGDLAHAESGIRRLLYDCAAVRLPSGEVCRVIIATHPATTAKPAVGVSQDGVVHELFYTALPQEGFCAADVVELYLHRGAFEQVLADEDQEQEPDRWCSQTPCGQEFWQLIAQWVWNLRLYLGHLSHPTPLRTTLFAAALEPSPAQPPAATATATATATARSPEEQEEGTTQTLSAAEAAVRVPGEDPGEWAASPVSHDEVGGPEPPETAHARQTGAHWARAARPGMFAGADFRLQEDGTVRCPAGQTLTLRERRLAPDGSLRLYYMAAATSCGPCLLREQCLRKGQVGPSPRKVSLLQHAPSLSLRSQVPATSPQPATLPKPPPPPLAQPVPPGDQPIVLKDWGRCEARRGWMRLMRTHLLEIEALPACSHAETDSQRAARVLPLTLTRPQRAHWRLSWKERLARNEATPQQPRWTLRLYGLPAVLAELMQSSR